MYNSKKYWNQRKDPNRTNDTTKIEEDIIPNIVENCENILDFGCGIGRTFKFYKGKSVTGLDFSEMYEDRAKNEAKNNMIDYNHIIHDVHSSDLPFTSKSFDLGIMVAVLLHAKHDEMVRILKEMSRVCKKIFLISYHQNIDINLSEHCFAHDYVNEIEKLGFSISFKEIFGNQIVIIYE